MHSSIKLPLTLPVLMWCSACVAQSTLGELLDAGASRLTAEEFRQEVVQRTLVGPSPTGGTMEVVYTASGRVTGIGSAPFLQATTPAQTQFDGEWSIDDRQRVCIVVSFLAYGGRGVSLPPRCQFWYRLGESYFFSDSDSDRNAKVLRRTVKK